MTPADCAAAHAALQARQAAPPASGLAAVRASLPIASFRAEILAACAHHQVVIVAGQTGCGKTTQVPQYLLEQAWAGGCAARIVCTQPRRISAVTVAERVASERGERCDGSSSVGYSIRLETRAGKHTALLFCTNGVLLRKLTQADTVACDGSSDGLQGVTHIVVDEIHERDLFADFLLIVLRDLLPRRPQLRLVLMSATLNEELFSGYFSGAPVIRVPGFTHPVVDFHLEDILPACGYGPPQASASAAGAGGGCAAPPVGAAWAGAVAAVQAATQGAFLGGSDEAFEALLEACTPQAGHPGLVNVAHGATGVTPLHAACAKNREDVAFALLAAGADAALRARDGSSSADFARRFGHAPLAQAVDEYAASQQLAGAGATRSLTLSAYQLAADPDEVDLDLLEKLLLFIHLHRGGHIAANAPGAILVFLPGWDEITRLRERLLAHPVLGDERTALLLPLHSMVPAADQRRVFARAPPGVRKIVLATNIAETAVTVDDCVFVVDAGRHKEKSYDAYAGVSTLLSAWISQASARQRRGRAGRCRPGECYRLYSSARLAALPEFQLPEMKRSPLEELVLQVKLLQTSPAGNAAEPAAAFLSRAVEAPLAAAVDAAVCLLTDIGALGERERLTPLGKHLAALPLHPRVGKMLLFAALFQCLDPVLTVAASAAARSPFVTPVDPAQRRGADAARRQFADAAGGSSDHLAVVSAHAAWEAARGRGGASAERQFCAANYVSGGTMSMIAGLRQQLSGALTQRGIISGSAQAASSNARAAPGLVRSVLGAGMYPLVGTLLPSGGPGPGGKPTLATLRGEKVRIHPSSVNGPKAGTQPESSLPGELPRILAFEELVRGEAYTFVRDCTAIAPHVLLLIAARLDVLEDLVETPAEGDGLDEDGDADMGNQERRVFAPSSDTALLVVDSWLRFRVPLSTVAHLSTLRLRLAEAFAARVQRSHQPLSPALAAAVHAAATMLAAETGGMVPAQGAQGALQAMEVFRAQGGGRGGRGGRRGGGPRSQGEGRGRGGRAPLPRPQGGDARGGCAGGGRRGGHAAPPAPRPQASAKHTRFE